MKGIDAIGIKLNDLCEITTNGAPSMIGREKGSVTLLENEKINLGGVLWIKQSVVYNPPGKSLFKVIKNTEYNGNSSESC